MTDTLNLKPCPFCGGKAEVATVKTAYSVGHETVQCTNCMAFCGPQDEGAVKHWNTRSGVSSEISDDVKISVTHKGKELGCFTLHPDIAAHLLSGREIKGYIGGLDASIPAFTKGHFLRLENALDVTESAMLNIADISKREQGEISGNDFLKSQLISGMDDMADGKIPRDKLEECAIWFLSLLPKRETGEALYGKSPAMKAVGAMKEYNALPPEERARLATDFIDSQMGAYEAMNRLHEAFLEAVDTLECLRRGHGIETGAMCVETLNKVRPLADLIRRNSIEGGS